MSDDDWDFYTDVEGDCTACAGTGEVVHDWCHGSGCAGCLDGVRTCPACDGSGYANGFEERLDEDGGPLAMSDMIPW
jgi:hypothetical protein